MAHLRLSQDFLSFLSELAHFCNHTWSELTARILSKFFSCKFAADRTCIKPGEQEGECGQAEKLVLRLLAVLVHGLTNCRELNQGVRQEVIVLVVPMRQDKQLGKLDEFEARLFAESFEQARKLLFSEDDKRFKHRLFIFAGLPLIEVRLVGKLEKESHRTEARPLEEEIKVLVVIALALLRPLRVFVANFTWDCLLFFNGLVRVELNDLRFLFLCCRLAFEVQLLFGQEFICFFNFLALRLLLNCGIFIFDTNSLTQLSHFRSYPFS